MPVDFGHGRHGRQSDQDVPISWECPGCGTKNIGRPETGCPSCKAGVAQVVEPPPQEPGVQHAARPAAAQAPRNAVAAVEQPAAMRRVLRLIEYLVKPGQEDALRGTLQRSLIGHVNMGWGTITGTIVDTVDGVQEDRLRMAHQQPGVWLTKPEVNLPPAPGEQSMRQIVDRLRVNDGLIEQAHQPAVDPVVIDAAKLYAGMQLNRRNKEESEARLMQDVGREPSDATAEIALRILGGSSFQIIHTLALALQSIAPELDANSEPEKFLTSDQALELAQALMNLVPAEWQGDAAGAVDPTA